MSNSRSTTIAKSILVLALLCLAVNCDGEGDVVNRFNNIDELRMTSGRLLENCYYRNNLLYRIRRRMHKLHSSSAITVKKSMNPKEYCKKHFSMYKSCCNPMYLEEFVNSRITQARTQFQQFLTELPKFQKQFVTGNEINIYSKLQYMNTFVASYPRRGDTGTRDAMKKYSSMSAKIYKFLNKEEYARLKSGFYASAQKCFDKYVNQMAGSYCFMCTQRNQNFQYGSSGMNVRVQNCESFVKECHDVSYFVYLTMASARAIYMANSLLAMKGDSYSKFFVINSKNQSGNSTNLERLFRQSQLMDWDDFKRAGKMNELCQNIYTIDNVSDELWGDGKMLKDAIASDSNTIASATIKKKIDDNVTNLKLQFENGEKNNKNNEAKEVTDDETYFKSQFAKIAGYITKANGEVKKIEDWYPKFNEQVPKSSSWNSYKTNIQTAFTNRATQLGYAQGVFNNIYARSDSFFNRGTISEKRTNQIKTYLKKVKTELNKVEDDRALRFKIVEKAWNKLKKELQDGCKKFDDQYDKEWYPEYHKYYQMNNPAPTRRVLQTPIQDLLKKMKTIHESMTTNFNKMTHNTKVFRDTWGAYYINLDMIESVRWIMVDTRKKAHFIEMIMAHGRHQGGGELRPKLESLVESVDEVLEPFKKIEKERRRMLANKHLYANLISIKAKAEKVNPSPTNNTNTNTNIAQKEATFGYLSGLFGYGDNYADLDIETNLVTSEKTKLDLSYARILTATFVLVFAIFMN